MNRPIHIELVNTLSKPGEEIKAQLTDFDCELLHMGTGLASDAGEVLDIIKKITIYRKPMDSAMVEHMREELGDVLFYWRRIGQMFGLPQEEIEEANIDKLLKRYEGAVYSDKAAQERKDKLA